MTSNDVNFDEEGPFPTELMRSPPTAPARSAALLVVALLLGSACHAADVRSTSGPASDPARRIANLHAFARLYGVVRWFHPSDAAAVIDWDRFAIDGARRVIDAPDPRALRATLAELIAPFAPTAHLAAAGEAFPEEPALHPGSAAGLDVIAWQHSGYGDSNIATGYASKRRHRGRTMAVRGGLFVALSQSIDATPYRGSHVRLRGKLRTANHGQGQLWLRVDRGESRGFFDNMDRRPIINYDWAPAEITGRIAHDATRVIFGILYAGTGTVWYDDFELAVATKDGEWKPVKIPNAGFEASEQLTSWNAGVGKPGRGDSLDGWAVTIEHDRPASGTSSLRIEPKTRIETAELFDDSPTPGETVNVDLGSGLRARIPIALYSRNNRTIGDDVDLARRIQASPSRTPATYDAVAGVADVIVVWNVFEHFWPYWNVVSVDWNAELDIALVDALDDHTVDDHVATLERLTVVAPDDHVGVSCPGEGPIAYPPFAVGLLEDHVVVTASSDPAVKRGDVLLSLDGIPATQLLAREQARISGSPQWRVLIATSRFGRGAPGSRFALRLRRDGREQSATISRSEVDIREEPAYPPIHRFEDGVYYVSLGRARTADVAEVTDLLATAPGVIFDVRGGANMTYEVLAHLLTRRDEITAWEMMPRVIRPSSGSNPSSWEDTSGRDAPLLQLQPRQPHISRRVAFLTNAGAMSGFEDIMTLVEYYHLGEIFGSATAGTDGNVAEILGPTGCRTRFTGRRVTRIGGSQLHLIGVQPTVPVSRTIAGVTAGKDEILERALAYVRGGSK